MVALPIHYSEMQPALMCTPVLFPHQCTRRGGKQILTLFCWWMQQHARQGVLYPGSKLKLCEINLECVQHGHWYAGEGQGRSVGLHSASTSSLQHVQDEGMNGSSGFAHHPAHVRTTSMADSAGDTAQASGELFKLLSGHVSCLHLLQEPWLSAHMAQCSSTML